MPQILLHFDESTLKAIDSNAPPATEEGRVYSTGSRRGIGMAGIDGSWLMEFELSKAVR